MEARYKPMLNLFLVISMGIVAAMVYYRAYALWYSLGYSSDLVHEIMGNVYRSHLMDSQIPMKLLAIFFATFSLSIKTGASKDIPWPDIIGRLATGVVLFFGADIVLKGHVTNARYLVYVVLLLTGYICYWSGAIRLGRRIRHYAHELDDEDDTFKQCRDLVENDYSINIPMKYQWKKIMHDGWINVINPFRGRRRTNRAISVKLIYWLKLNVNNLKSAIWVKQRKITENIRKGMTSGWLGTSVGNYRFCFPEFPTNLRTLNGLNSIILSQFGMCK